MKLLFLFLYAFTATHADETSGQYLGVTAIENKLSQRNYAEKFSFANVIYTIDYSSQDSYKLLALLGTWTVTGTESHFTNGRPNPINAAIWSSLFSFMSHDIFNTCNGTQKLMWSQPFKETVRQFCNWPSSAAQDQMAIQNLWISIMGYDAPKDEFDAWHDFILTQTNTSAEIAVPKMLNLIFMNPHYLLRK